MPFLREKVPDAFAESMRLDKYVASRYDELSRSRLKSCVREILINGRSAKLSAKIKAGDAIDIEWENDVPDDIAAENIPLAVIYEDDDVAVIDKAQGMVTHPAAGNWSGTLLNALLFHWGRGNIAALKAGSEREMLASHRPGIVHRLDKDTSGVIITAKNRAAQTWLENQFKTRRVRKEYIAIVKGRPPALAGDIRTQIVRDAKHRKRFKAATQTEEGKAARTIYHCLASYGNYSLMRLRLKTGRTHQIRVHMKYIGCPVLGDSLYGKADEFFPDATLMLHARMLTIRLPGEKKFTTFHAKIPCRFYEVVRVLRSNYPKEVMRWGKNHAKKKH